MRNHRDTRPRWLSTRYAGTCARCGRAIPKGENALYFPADKKVLCAGENCGAQQQRDNDAAAFDEMQYNSQY